MKVLVCGGRDYGDQTYLFSVLDALNSRVRISEIIEGGATGADALAGKWALAHRVVLTECKADWQRNGRAAGPIRNQKMLDECKPDLVLAFPGGTGTADMVRRARAAKVEVLEED